INLAGSSKVPSRPVGGSHLRESLLNSHDVSFVGRPFPLEEADEHFARLKRWGFTFLRFLVTWEAIEHAEPGVYDEEYLDYLVAVLKKADQYGFKVYIDLHQDVWSRFCGGDGAPSWTLEAVGLDWTRFEETGAAILHSEYGPDYSYLLWFSNYDKLAAATMFTLFYGGNDFAPRTKIVGFPVQDVLQNYYIKAFCHLAERLKGLKNILGYGPMNEPSGGMIGRPLQGRPGLFPRGLTPSFYQSMLLGCGYPQKALRYALRLPGLRLPGSGLLNPNGARAWKEGYDCVWKENGVWDLDEQGQPRLLQPDYFRPGKVHFHRDYYRPFANRFANAIRQISPDAMMFLEGIPEDNHLVWDGQDAGNVVHAGHWYDGVTMVTGRFLGWFSVDHRLGGRPIFGRRRVQAMLNDQVADRLRVSAGNMGGPPTLIGEFGIPFDIGGGLAFRTGDFTLQTVALDSSMITVETNMVSSTLWNYSPDNTNKLGDGWNREDFSIFSRDQMKNDGSPDDGGRALRGIVRPYPIATAGEPTRIAFSLLSRRFELIFHHNPAVTAPTEIFVPLVQYPRGCHIEISDGRYVFDQAAQLLTYYHSEEKQEHKVTIHG
ncbi:MAG TPA: cellulase family glycosylhydrolase, partial [Anaerolineaceae bacterium]|nr:cellulase family glycosylhydrolase [Anaerolineaceae bacterium]